MFGWLAHRRIVHKLALGFALVLLLTGATMAVNVTVSVRQSALAARLAEHYIPARAAARDIVLWVRAADDDGAWYVMARNPAQAATLLHTYYAVDVPGVQRSVQ